MAGIVVLSIAAVSARSVALAGFGPAVAMFLLAAGKARTGRALDNPGCCGPGAGSR